MRKMRKDRLHFGRYPVFRYSDASFQTFALTWTCIFRKIQWWSWVSSTGKAWRSSETKVSPAWCLVRPKTHTSIFNSYSTIPFEPCNIMQIPIGRLWHAFWPKKYQSYSSLNGVQLWNDVMLSLSMSHDLFLSKCSATCTSLSGCLLQCL